MCLLCACGTPESTAVAIAVGATAAGSYAPTSDIEQVYYLGVFDPQEQVPPTVYRVRIRGQASLLSRMDFSTGWVKAELIDSLGTRVTSNQQTGAVSIEGADEEFTGLTTGRRLMMFGPEGFREAPKDHRLVIVMGASPEKFFNAMDTAFQEIAEAEEIQRNEQLQETLQQILFLTQSEREQLEQLSKDLAADLKTVGGAS